MNSKDGIKRGPFGSSLKKSFFVKKSDYVVYEQQNAIYDQFSTRYFINEVKYNELEAFSLKPNDFILSGSGTIGCISLVPDNIKKGVINQALIRIRINQNITNKFFFLQWMRSSYMQRRLTQANPGSAITNLVPISEIKNWKVTVPNNKIQKHIGKILTQLDTLLSLQQRKLELEKQLELYVTDDLLVYETESKIIPKVRFNSFCQSWKKVKLKEIIGKIQSGNRLPKTNLEEGSIPYILAQSKNNGIYMYISKDTLDFNGNALKLFPADSITFSIDNPQAIYYQPEPFYTSNIMRVIHSQHLNKFDYMFIIMNLKKYTKEFDWSRKFSGPVVSNLQVSIPGNIDERRKIGKLICKIQLHRLLDEKAKREIIKLKRFLLQNLFI
ncbi:restriction endonuclease subunit S [Lactobacillus mulieris]|uniref:Restriction endonuclease subunit S n=1 Tax=Lactobacillus mulieris TaxID=2508708 RepID=A0ABT4K0K5_9LACO|nr:restriction endonuclease subunit S [Lactobacillus mulieris]MCZ3621651.1 restriction endonuclease subunit S [Lactobacillus mulieris]MCZ3623074.1 restriction endonuclease subunit S [Lactobacillus mulieris]MCZ3635658.1 restriction endonuclease subunit S [Lactobacillus mulieris]